MKGNQALGIINKASLGVLTLLFFFFPLFFLTNTTEAFILPKQILLVITSSILLVLWGASCIAERKLIIKSSPLNIPVALFGVVVIVSSLLSRNLYDSLSLSIPVFAIVVLFFITINTIHTRRDFMVAFAGLVVGAAASTLISILYNFNIFFLPIAAIENRYFTTFGSPVQHLIYIVPLALVGVLALAQDFRAKKLKATNINLFIGATSAIIVAGVAVFAYQIITAPQKPVFLPYTYGFQIATAAISQDSSRFLRALPFGSGYGTFLTDFTRYKFPDINLNPTLWNTTFTSSSSLVLELIATTGILGLLSYLFIVAKILKTRSKEANPLFFGLLGLFAASFFLPFSLVNIFLLLVLSGLYIAYLGVVGDRRVFDVSISLVAFRHGLISFQDMPEHARPRRDSVVFPVLITILIVLVSGFLSFQAIRLYSADTKMAASLSQANRNNGQRVYDLQLAALKEFPYRSDYYRIFSQINLALANSIVSGLPQGSTPPEETRATITNLLQQAVNNARAAVALAQITALNWENLSQIYRNLIGVGEGAPEFTILTLNQAIALDPANPLLRIELGGVYYQLQQYDPAINQFNIAIELKPDLANAYYNRGHAFEMKNDLQAALRDYQIALNLLTNDSDKQQLTQEIEALQARAGEAAPEGQTGATGQTENQPPLGINEPEAPIPTAVPTVRVSPPPAGAVEVTPLPTTTPSPAQEE